MDELSELQEIIEERNNVDDEASKDPDQAPQSYNITSYGADFDVDGLVRRLRNKHIFIPSFQRDYVWNLSDASRLVESLLLGLPVPGIFLAKETDSQRLLVIDGQQRLKTLLYFMDGFFNPNPTQRTQRVFKLTNVQANFEGKTYEMLDERDKNKLRDTIIHATIIKQESPENDDTSVYHVFERLNTGGRKLMPQEIRAAIFHGPFNDLLHRLNGYDDWRTIFGRESNRMKDQELILRFLAMYTNWQTYEKPMSEFLSKFSKSHRNLETATATHFAQIFEKTATLVAAALGPKAFRPERALNAAVFDAVMVGLAKRLEREHIDVDDFTTKYEKLLDNSDFKTATSAGTSDVSNVESRMKIAIQTFST